MSIYCNCKKNYKLISWINVNYSQIFLAFWHLHLYNGISHIIQMWLTVNKTIKQFESAEFSELLELLLRPQTWSLVTLIGHMYECGPANA